MQKKTRQLQAENTKKAIVTAIEHLMGSKAIDNIKIRDICKLAGVSIGTFYLYFSCKEEAVLYIYRDKDRIFNEICLTDNPKENIALLMEVYYHMVDLNNLPYVRHLYICHLTYFDEYFFSEERTIFRLLNDQIAQLTEKDTKSITWELLEYSRGKIYNLCISFVKADITWYEVNLQKTMKYLDFLLY